MTPTVIEGLAPMPMMVWRDGKWIGVLVYPVVSDTIENPARVHGVRHQDPDSGVKTEFVALTVLGLPGHTVNHPDVAVILETIATDEALSTNKFFYPLTILVSESDTHMRKEDSGFCN